MIKYYKTLVKHIFKGELNLLLKKILHYPLIRFIKNARKKIALKYIEGNGIEIGALHTPLYVNDKAKVTYMDFFFKEELIRLYPTIKPEDIVDVGVIGDGQDLKNLKSDSQDFLILNHVFEHLSNPIGALKERYRVLKNNGIVYLAIPDKNRTFDINRPRTKLQHLIDDYKNPSKKRDFEHFEEFIKTDYFSEETKKEKGYNDPQKLLESGFSIHYHVFIEKDVREIIDYTNKEGITNFSILHVKHTSKIIYDNEFIFVLRCNK